MPPALSILTEALSSFDSPPPSRNAEQEFTYDPLHSVVEPTQPGTVTANGQGEPQETASHSGAIVSFDSSVDTVIFTSDHYVLGSATLQQGQATTISGLAINADPSGFVVNSQTLQVSALPVETKDPQTTILGVEGFTIAVSSVSGNSQAAVIGSQTIADGGPAVTISDHVISHGSEGFAFISNSKTIPFTEVPTPTPSVLAAGSLTVLASGDSDAIAIDGTTLTAGGPAATISGQVVTHGSAGLLLVGTQSTAVFSQTSDPGTESKKSLTFATASITGESNAISVFDTTLSVGGSAAVVDGTILTMGSSGLEVVSSGTTTLPAIASSNSTQTLPSLVTTTASTSTEAEEPSRPSESTTSTSTASPAKNSARDWMLSLVVCLVLHTIVLR